MSDGKAHIGGAVVVGVDGSAGASEALAGRSPRRAYEGWSCAPFTR